MKPPNTLDSVFPLPRRVFAALIGVALLLGAAIVFLVLTYENTDTHPQSTQSTHPHSTTSTRIERTPQSGAEGEKYGNLRIVDKPTYTPPTPPDAPPLSETGSTVQRNDSGELTAADVEQHNSSYAQDVIREYLYAHYVGTSTPLAWDRLMERGGYKFLHQHMQILYLNDEAARNAGLDGEEWDYEGIEYHNGHSATLSTWEADITFYLSRDNATYQRTITGHAIARKDALYGWKVEAWTLQP